MHLSDEPKIMCTVGSAFIACAFITRWRKNVLALDSKNKKRKWNFSLFYFVLCSFNRTFALRNHQYLMKRILDILHKCLIVRELPPPVAVCSIDKHSYVFNLFTLSRMGFAHRGRFFLFLAYVQIFFINFQFLR